MTLDRASRKQLSVPGRRAPAVVIGCAGLLLAAYTVVTSAGCLARKTDQTAARPGSPGHDAWSAEARAPSAFQALSDSRLANAHIVTDKVISGAQPHDEQSFLALAELGVRTIISVDGARPDAQAARRHGMRYVHIPITYGTVTDEQARALARAIDEMPGRIYIHCHHGKHRSAAATAVACVLAGQLPAERAEQVLQTFGTGENYDGLWRAAREARPLDEAAMKELRGMEIDFVEAAAVPELAEAMLAIDFHAENLKLVQKSGWKPPADHPDLSPAHEALQLEEYLRELGRSGDVAARPEDFGRMLAQSERAARNLRELISWGGVGSGAAADEALALVTASCTQCHRAYRD
jgi:protein tyrosine phosphatase (PTP) superfamily phosphohydrolase (DUF442 family)